jgi:DNA-binding MarR family transcriptional regulator
MPMRTASIPAPAAHPEADLLDAIRDAQQALVIRLIPLVVQRGLGNQLFWMLWHLARGAQPHPSLLAHKMGITPPALTAIVDQLVEGGYVARRPSDEDRRQIVLVVTPKGRRTLDAIWSELDASLSGALEGLPREDVRVTARTLRSLSTRLTVAPGEGVRA